MKRVSITVSPEEHAMLTAIAKSEHLSLSTFVKRVALNEDKRTPGDFAQIASKLNIYEGWAAKTAPPQYLKMNGSKNAFFVDGSDSNKYMVVITDGKKEVTLDEDSPYFNQFK